ncbi:hypothetical protein [Poriferisphaera sp. WC338]|uniref:hypothetical protein n=1 Tax=Poriferisphaera sp. WC338 TaxID=3425129 RepID=UPI003D8155F8
MKTTLALTTVLAALFCVTLTLSPSKAQAYPEPAIVSTSWVIDVKFEKPTAIAVKDRFGVNRWYWYLPYRAINNTSSDRILSPEFTIATDSGKIIQAGKNVPLSVYRAIEKQLNNPLLLSPLEIVDKILQGDDYAKESVAIWPAFDHDVDEFSVFVAGLSGESATVKNVLTGDDVLLRRTIMLTYNTPGNNINALQDQPVILKTRRDVMR